MSLGLLFALFAFLSWGFGDFFIQRTVRQVGDVAALLAIGLFGFVVLTPFVWNDIPTLFSSSTSLGLLALVGGVTTLVALVEFQAFKVGKLSVIEPVLTLELPLTVLFGVFVLREHLTTAQIVCVLAVCIGIVLTAVERQRHHWWDMFRHGGLIEAGVGLGILGAFLMTLTNVYTGVASQQTGPLVAMWGINGILAFVSLCILALRHQVASEIAALQRSWRAVLGECVFDNIAWVSYAAAVVTLPISLTIAITESYVVLSSVLGIIFNRERLQRHQYSGMAIAIVASILLAIVTK